VRRRHVAPLLRRDFTGAKRRRKALPFVAAAPAAIRDGSLEAFVNHLG
jgi:hypothetical protein